MNFRIRELEISDANDLAQIYSSIVRKPINIDFKKRIKNHVECENDICFVAETEDRARIVGFMVSYILPLSFGVEISAWIATLGVHPDYMGHGIGDKLAREIFKVYKKMGINRIYTSVTWNSVDLLSFFNSLGFERSKFINLTKNLDHESMQEDQDL